MNPEQLRADGLSRRIKAHKAEIRRRRQLLSQDKAELVALEKECSERGIKLNIQGEGEAHGQHDGTGT
jgi:hypothetical protein